MGVLSDEVVLEDLEKRSADRIKQPIRVYEEKKEELFQELELRFEKEFKDSKHESRWGAWKEYLEEMRSKLIERYGEKDKQVVEDKFNEIGRYLDRLDHVGITITSGKGYWLADRHNKIVRYISDRSRSDLFAKEGMLSTFYRLLGVIKEIYDHKQYDSTLETLRTCIRERKPPEGFRLLNFLFTYYPDAIFYREDADKGTASAQYLNELIHYIDAFALYHPFLYTTSKLYRDHILHHIRVTWLMEKLFEKWEEVYLESTKRRLEKMLTERSSILDMADLLGAVKGQRIRVKFEGTSNAVIAGVFHDLLYPVSSLFNRTDFSSMFANRFSDLGKIVVPALENRLLKYLILEEKLKDQTAVNAIEYQYRHHGLNLDYIPAFQKQFFDHGVLGAAMLKDLPCEARQAIALTHLKGVKIDLMDTPIAFFLVLCDEAQEWGRWLLSEKKQEYFSPCDEICLNLTQSEFEVKIDFSKKSEEIIQQKPTFSFETLCYDKFLSLRRLKVPSDANIRIRFSLVDPEGEWEINCLGPSFKWRLTTPG